MLLWRSEMMTEISPHTHQITKVIHQTGGPMMVHEDEWDEDAGEY